MCACVCAITPTTPPVVFKEKESTVPTACRLLAVSLPDAKQLTCSPDGGSEPLHSDRFSCFFSTLFILLSVSPTGRAGSRAQIGVKSLPNRREIGCVIFGAESRGDRRTIILYLISM